MVFSFLVYYYLGEAKHTNSEGLLTPFRSQRCHLHEWTRGREPRTAEECYNMKYAKTQNRIEEPLGYWKLDGVS